MAQRHCGTDGGLHPGGRPLGRSRVVRAVAVLVLSGGLAHCGFHVRGDARLPFRTLAIVGGENTALVVDLKRALRGSTKVSIVDKPEQAETVLYILTNQNDKSILTLSGGGRVREFQLTQKIIFRLADASGNEWMPASEISVRRDFSFNDSQALAKEGEERLLVADMQADAVQQLLRRLTAARRPG
ncbi:MAG: LPS assembly lipoprotein LptE [Acidobacteriota bacterium]